MAGATQGTDQRYLLDRVEEIARRAGAAISEIYREANGEVAYKADDSPLTAADLASHRVIIDGLQELTPEIPKLSEEGAQMPFEQRAEWEVFWLIDPLDGTKEFVRRNGEFTVNIALIERGVPVLGVVYAPILDRMYLAIDREGAWRRDGAGAKESIRASGTGEGPLAVVASRSHPGPDLASFLERLPDHRTVSMGSSLKLCLIAEGAADIYPRLGPTMEWDTGAAHAVVRAAGGLVVNLDADPLVYNKPNLLNPHFIVLGERPVAWQEACGQPTVAV